MGSVKKVILLLGRKLGMSRMCDGAGNSIAVTAIHVSPCQVVGARTKSEHGYAAVQVGAEQVDGFRLAKAEAGHCLKSKCQTYRHLMEIRVDDPAAYGVGESLDLALLAEGDFVDVRGTTKGRGFQGVMKRYGFGGGPDGHGSMFHRRGGSYGQREEPGRIYPGRKMPGHMGHVKRTTQNLCVARVCADRQMLFLCGSVVGCNGGLVSIRTAKKG
ncbi:MAG: 50S ribosomal protein L3 [Puniceicoccales bacterium]|jgi:large subunit ribosomal protein L3|nr:50S ribosomal protein L3 [Puniceicoccales bacterium]